MKMEELYEIVWKELMRENVKYSFDAVRTMADKVLFQELDLSVEIIERYYIPFQQSGYLSIMQKFTILLWSASRISEGNGAAMLLEQMEWKTTDRNTLYGKDVEQLYLNWKEKDLLELSEADKKKLFVEAVCFSEEVQVLEQLINQNPGQILAGEYMRQRWSDNSKKQSFEMIGVCLNEMPVLLDFLSFSEEERMISYIQSMVAQYNNGELTAAMPVWEGNGVKAIRPPAGEWGFAISAERSNKRW